MWISEGVLVPLRPICFRVLLKHILNQVFNLADMAWILAHVDMVEIYTHADKAEILTHAEDAEILTYADTVEIFIHIYKGKNWPTFIS